MIGAIVQVAVAAAKDINRTIAGGVEAKRAREDAMNQAQEDVLDIEAQRKEQAESFDKQVRRERRGLAQQAQDIKQAGMRQEKAQEKAVESRERDIRSKAAEDVFGIGASMGAIEEEEKKLRRLGGR